MNTQPEQSSLFLVRVWAVEGDGEGPGWRGKVLHVVSGEALPFGGWSGLEAAMQELLRAEAEPEPEERSMSEAGGMKRRGESEDGSKGEQL